MNSGRRNRLISAIPRLGTPRVRLCCGNVGARYANHVTHFGEIRHGFINERKRSINLAGPRVRFSLVVKLRRECL